MNKHRIHQAPAEETNRRHQNRDRRFFSVAGPSSRMKSSIIDSSPCIAMHSSIKSVKGHQAHHHFVVKRLVSFEKEKGMKPSWLVLYQEGAIQRSEEKKKKSSSARKTRASSREENHALGLRCSVRPLFANSTRLQPRYATLQGAIRQKAQSSSAITIYMTAQEPCSAVAMTLAAGGEAEAETEVQEDPAVLRLRRAMPLPPAMGIA